MKKKAPPKIVLTCEHAGNEVPKKLRSFFKGSSKLRESHRGWDFGALAVAKIVQRNLNTCLFYSKTTRLVVDLNRSVENPTLFSKFITPLDEKMRFHILSMHYHPYRKMVKSYILRKLAAERKTRIAHFSIHSFTPVLKGKIRTCEIGLLYDPKFKFEEQLAERLRLELRQRFPDLRIKMNYPYRGDGDGQTTILRNDLPKGRYAGIEIEMNKKWITDEIKRGRLKKTSTLIAEALHEATRAQT